MITTEDIVAAKFANASRLGPVIVDTIDRGDDPDALVEILCIAYPEFDAEAFETLLEIAGSHGSLAREYERDEMPEIAAGVGVINFLSGYELGRAHP